MRGVSNKHCLLTFFINTESLVGWEKCRSWSGSLLFLKDLKGNVHRTLSRLYMVPYIEKLKKISIFYKKPADLDLKGQFSKKKNKHKTAIIFLSNSLLMCFGCSNESVSLIRFFWVPTAYGLVENFQLHSYLGACGSTHFIQSVNTW